MRDYIKHLVKCRCILQQYKKLPEPPFHKFVVFSEIDENAMIVPSFAQCPNCGVVHKIEEVGISKILKKEDLTSVLSKEEMEESFPEKIRGAIAGYDLEMHQLQEINFVLENKAWGRSVILTKENAGNMISGKYIQIFSETLFKFGVFTREDLDAEK